MNDLNRAQVISCVKYLQTQYIATSSGHQWNVQTTHKLRCIFLFAANELTVGKVYAALMIFDYYKQNRAKRLQMQQQQQREQTGPGSQVIHMYTYTTSQIFVLFCTLFYNFKVIQL